MTILSLAVAASAVLSELVPEPRQVVARAGVADAVALERVTYVRGSVAGAPDRVAAEAYRLDVTPTGVTVTASADAGFLHAQTTLAQLRKLGGGFVPAATVVDWPKLRWRGFMLDTSRNYLDLPALRTVIDVMAGYKLNLFHWHLTEDFAWRLESKALPELQSEKAFFDPCGTRHAGKYYTQDEFREIVAYAADRGVTVMPEFDVPGHALAFRRALGYETMADKGVKERIGTLFDELCTLASPVEMPFVHVGGDEVWKSHEKAVPGALEDWYGRLFAAKRTVVRWSPGEKVDCDGPCVDMVWGRENPVGIGAPCLDAYGWYIEEFDPFEFLGAATYREPCNWTVPDERKLGAVFCAWHDCAAGLPYDNMLRNQCVFPACVMLGNLFWHGGAGSRPQYANRLPLAGDTLLAPAEDLERRVVAQRDRVLNDLPYAFPFVRQTQMRWRLSDEHGNVIAKDIAQATVYPFRMKFPQQAYWARTNGTVVAETWIVSPDEKSVGAWIGFTAFNRDHGRAYAAPMPFQGQWNLFGATAELNGEKISPPVWDNPGQTNGGPVPGVYGFSMITEHPFGNEEYFMREPTPIRLRKGVNHVRLTVPMPEWVRPWFHNWVFTFAPLLGTSARPREVPGLVYCSEPPQEI